MFSSLSLHRYQQCQNTKLPEILIIEEDNFIKSYDAYFPNTPSFHGVWGSKSVFIKWIACQSYHLVSRDHTIIRFPKFFMIPCRQLPYEQRHKLPFIYSKMCRQQWVVQVIEFWVGSYRVSDNLRNKLSSVDVNKSGNFEKIERVKLLLLRL